MKVRVLVLSLLALVAVWLPARADPPIPALTGRVVDAAGVLDASTVAGLTTQLQGYEASTTNQVVVVTLPDLQGTPIESWGLALGRGWGIGQKGKDNGVILIVAPHDRQLRIEVGYGLEGQLPDATANAIIRNEIVPRFKSGDINGGVEVGINAILEALGGSYAPTVPKVDGDGIGTTIAQYAGEIILGLLLIVFVISHIRRKYDPTRRRNVFYWYNDPTLSSGGGFSSGGHGFSGGFSSGGGGGFSGGGGSFGGGGASGHW